MQYSLRSLIGLMTGAAVVCFVLFVLPQPLSSILLSSCYLLGSTALLSLLIYGSGNYRAFAVGCILPITTCWLGLFMRGAPFGARNDLGFLLTIGILTLASGLVSVGVRRWCERQRVANGEGDIP